MIIKHHESIPRSLRTLLRVGTMTGLTDGQLLERFAMAGGETAEAGILRAWSEAWPDGSTYMPGRLA